MSTPGDYFLKSVLAIPADAKVDFIRWNLVLENTNSFQLDIVYGESKPNTLDFIGGGEKRSFKGSFLVSERGSFKKLYHLKSTEIPAEILLAKLNENILHLLSVQNQLIVGNGGWSYALNNVIPETATEFLFSTLANEDKSPEVTFDGRTPCREITKEHPEIQTNQSCFKLKWRLILRRDSVTHLPATYTIRKVVDGKRVDITGKWEVIKGLPKKPDAIIYKIESDNEAESFSFLVVDNNILLFLNRKNEPYIGNSDFSFILNRK